jgi:hypothetical protein
VKLLPLLLEGQDKNEIKHIKLAVFCGDDTDNKFKGMLRRYIHDIKNFENGIIGMTVIGVSTLHFTPKCPSLVNGYEMQKGCWTFQ